jgi:transposase
MGQSELRLHGVLRRSLRIELLLDHRLCWLRGGYRVRMPMHNLPPAVFRSKDHRNSQSERRYIFTSADLSLRPLYLNYVGKLSSYMLRYDLDANELAISDLRCGMLWCEPLSPDNLVSQLLQKRSDVEFHPDVKVKRLRRKHTREFKLKCCRQAATGEKRPVQICREHNLSESVLLRWRKEYETRSEAAFTEKQPSGDDALEARIAELERFCGQLSLENQILKKSLKRMQCPRGML